MAQTGVETRLDLSQRINDTVWKEWEVYKAFKSGNPYVLPESYASHPKRKIIAADPRGPWRDPIITQILSERVLQWDFKHRRLRTAIYAEGPFKPGFTFANLQPWDQRTESVAVRSVELSKPGQDLEVHPISIIPLSLVGDKARSLAMDYKQALWTKDRQKKDRVGREVRERLGLQLVMLGVNGPYFRMLEPAELTFG